MAQIKRLPDAELRVMQALWQAQGEATRPELDELLRQDTDWSATTVLNLLARLETRGFVTGKKCGRGYRYRALVTQEQYRQEESQSVLTRLFGGSVKQFVAALDGGNALSKSDVEELSAYLDELQKRGDGR